MTTTANVLLSAALGYAGHGWPVFPCRPDTKVPATAHGCKDATTDPVRIRAWWQKMPAANVAIATGEPGPDVVDVDCKHGAPGAESLGRLARAGLVSGAGSLVRTPSGGCHLYFDGTDQGNGAIAAHGIDFRGRGGYVVAPPSVVTGSPYLLEDRRTSSASVDWQRIRAFLVPPRPIPRVQPGQRPGVDALARWVAEQPVGNRNGGLYWAACRALESGAGDLAELVSAGVSAGLSDVEARRTVESARRKIGGAA